MISASLSQIVVLRCASVVFCVAGVAFAARPLRSAWPVWHWAHRGVALVILPCWWFSCCAFAVLVICWCLRLAGDFDLLLLLCWCYFGPQVILLLRWWFWSADLAGVILLWCWWFCVVDGFAANGLILLHWLLQVIVLSWSFCCGVVIRFCWWLAALVVLTCWWFCCAGVCPVLVICRAGNFELVTWLCRFCCEDLFVRIVNCCTSVDLWSR